MFVINNSIPYLLVITLIALLSINILYSRQRPKMGYLENSIKSLRLRYENFLSVNDDVSSPYDASIHRFATYYRLIHAVVTIVLIILVLLSFIINLTSTSKWVLLLLLFISALLYPRNTILGRRTAYSYLLHLFTGILKKELDFELYRLILHLKNLAVTSDYQKYSSDHILNSLYEVSTQTKPVLSKVIRLWNLGRLDEAVNFLSDSIDTPIAHELALILLKLDDLTTSELRSQIDLLLQTIRKERETSKIIVNEQRSNLVYFVVIATSVVIMLNFVVIVYYLEAMNNIQHYIN